MTTYRSQAIREVETDLQAARARAMIRTPRFAGRTYSEVKAERQRRRERIMKMVGYVLVILTAATVAAKSCAQ